MWVTAIAISAWVGLLVGPFAGGAFRLGLGLVLSLLAFATWRRSVTGSGLALIAAALVWATLLSGTGGDPVAQSGLARVRATVQRSNCGTWGCWSEAQMEACDPIEPGTCPALGSSVGLRSEAELPWRSTVSFVGRIHPLPRFRNAGPHPIAWDPRPTVAVEVSDHAPLRVVESSLLGTGVSHVRSMCRRALERSLHAPHAGIARALLLGEGSAVPRELDQAIRNAGVSHVLAVSGMHVTVLAGALVALVRWLWLLSPLALRFPAARAAAAAGVVLAPLVAAVCGGAPSAWRAGWTSMLMFGLRAWGRSPCPLRVSAFTVAVYGLADPPAALHPGLVLSVLATGALLTAQRAHEGPKLVALFRESLRPWLGTLPFLVWSFGGASFVALLANIVLLPIGALLIPVAVGHLGAELVGISASAPTAWLFEVTSGAFVGASRYFAELDPALVVPPLTLTQGLCIACASWVWLMPCTLRTRLSVVALAVVVGLACEWHVRHPLSADELRVTFLDVGQGDAALIELGTGETALIDGGGAANGGPDPGALVIAPLLAALRIDGLDLVVLTHPHPDHYGGLHAVLSATHVRELWDTGQGEAEDAQGAASKLVQAARSRGTRVLRPSALCGHPRALGAATLEVLAPCPGFDEGFGPNDNSFVLRIRHGERSFLFTGDVEHEAEAGLVRARASTLKADVLKVPHHGSRTSSTDPFVRAVAPQLAVISAGRANRFGHPHVDVLDRLRALVPHVLRTDQMGGIQITSDGHELHVTTAIGDVELTCTAADGRCE